MAWLSSGCAGSISIGHDDTKLNRGADGGATSSADGGPPNSGAGGSGASTSSGAGGSGVSPSNPTPPTDRGGVTCLPEDGPWTSLLQISGPLPELAKQVCAQLTATEDMDISALRVQNTYPVQVQLWVSEPSGPDGSCDVTDVTQEGPGYGQSLRQIAWANAGAGQSDFGNGVALHIARGKQLRLMTQSDLATHNGMDGSASVDIKLATSPTVALPMDDGWIPTGLNWFVGVDVIPSWVPKATARAARCETPWHPLLTANVEVPPHSEADWCVRRTLTTDLDIGSIRLDPASVPAGVSVSDVVVSVVAPGDGRWSPDGEGVCVNPGYAASLLGIQAGTGEVHYADGSGAHITTGLQVVLKAHVKNDSAVIPQGQSVVVEYQASSP
jgi:hypothetical protein